MRLALVPLLLLIGCGPKLVEDEVDGFRRISGVIKTSRKGKRGLKLDPLPGETAVILSSIAPDGVRTHIAQVDGADGVLFEAQAEADGDRATTNAGYVAPVATLNWPRHPGDRLEALDITLGSTVNSFYAKAELEVEALFKSDPDLTTGVLPITLIYAGGTDGDADVRAAVEEAVDRWAELYSGVGIQLELTEEMWENSDLAAPVYGTETDYAAMGESLAPYTVQVVVAPLISDVEDVLGVAGDIPGPLSATTRSAVLVSAVTSAGTDGEFSAAEVRILGETLAHEVGHYLGLFHPVEKTWKRWDAVTDTPECGGEKTCTNRLGEYLMFPFPVCTFTGCIPQELITDGQSAVMHRYTGLR